jgi:DNA-binding transcriptional MerR regulator
VPSIADARGTGSERKYSFSDLLAFRVARELREAGVSTQSLRRIIDFLRTRKGLTNPFAECRLIVTGSDVQIATSNKMMSALVRPGQTSFAFVFDLARTVDQMKQAIKITHRKAPARAWATHTARNRKSARAV